MSGTFELRLWQLRFALWVAIWVGLAILASLWSLTAGLALLAVGVILLWLLQRSRRGIFANRPRPTAAAPATPDDPAQRAREARYMVTQLLRQLTRVQVTYLCQDFETPRRGLSWLRRALPRGYRPVAEELFQQLERARQGEASSGTELAVAIVARREGVLRTIEALDRAKQSHPDHLISNPVIFVITEHLSANERDRPEVVTLAGWNPSRPTLIPEVDLINLFSEQDKQRQIRGQAALQAIRHALGAKLRRVSEEPAVYAVAPLEHDPVGRDLRLSKVPLGFVIGTAELM